MEEVHELTHAIDSNNDEDRLDAELQKYAKMVTSENIEEELQNIADMVTSDNMEEELQITHSSKTIEEPTIVGDGDMFDASDEFLSLTTKVYENREDLISDVRRIGLVQGFVVVIKRSRPGKGNVTLGCDRGGSYKTTVSYGNKKNNSSSRLIDCPFKVMGRKKAERVWKVEIISLLHNHVRSTNMSGHPYCRRFSKEKAKQLKQMDRAGIKPRQILSSLRQNNPHLLAVSRDVYSKTAEFRKESQVFSIQVLTYIENTWLPLKEKFVNAWTGQISHFGNSATSRTEGAHATLKRYLEVSKGGLREVKEKVCLAIENQFQEIKTQLENEKIRVPRKLYIPFFKETINKVSFHALFEVHKQYVLANTKDYSTICKGQFYKTMGLPCVHMIKEKNFEVLPLNQIHEQWRIDARSFDDDLHASLVQEDPLTTLLSDIKQKYEKQPLVEKESTIRQLAQIIGASPPLIFEPTIQSHKGRPVGAANKRKETSSTRRELSLFEIVEKTARKCSRCGNIGHYKNKCQSINNAFDLGTQ